MNNANDIWPISREVLLSCVKYAKRQPCYEEAKQVEALLNNLFRGCNNTEAFDLIDSIPYYFKEERDRLAEERASARMEKIIRKRMNLPEILVDDEQIDVAITKITNDPIMNSRRDWGGIGRILIDFCGWPDVKKDFEHKVMRMKQMGFLKNLPADKDFTYQALQAGLSSDWPNSYKEWLIKTDGDNTFEHRREVAKTFLDYLKNQQRQAFDY